LPVWTMRRVTLPPLLIIGQVAVQLAVHPFK
jgi:hypothetical protein